MSWDLAISPDGQTLAFHVGPKPEGAPGPAEPREILLRRGEFAPGQPFAYIVDPDGYTIEIWFE